MTEQNKNRQIQITDNFPGVEYSNVMQVRHNKDEFYLLFLNVFDQSGRVCAKIVTSPGHMKRMILAMQENLKLYETSFGPITSAVSPTEGIGFNTEKK